MAQITKAEVIAQSPSLADRIARSTTDATAEEIAREIADVIRNPRCEPVCRGPLPSPSLSLPGPAVQRSASNRPASSRSVSLPKELRLSNSSLVPEPHTELVFAIFGQRAPRWLSRLVEFFWPPSVLWSEAHDLGRRGLEALQGRGGLDGPRSRAARSWTAPKTSTIEGYLIRRNQT